MGAITRVDKAGQSIVGYEFMQTLAQWVGRCGHDFVEIGVLAEETADEYVVFAFVGEVISCNLLLGAIWDIPKEHGLCMQEALCLVQIVH